MKKLQLTIAERLLLSTLLPQQGGKITMKLTAQIEELIDFSAAEINQFEIRDEGNGLIRWNPQKEQLFEFELWPEQVQILKQAAEEADRAERITRQMLPLVEKIDAL